MVRFIINSFRCLKPKICTNNYFSQSGQLIGQKKQIGIAGKLYLNIMYKLHICKYLMYCLVTIYYLFPN